jgi:hypothetical protein
MGLGLILVMLVPLTGHPMWMGVCPVFFVQFILRTKTREMISTMKKLASIYIIAGGCVRWRLLLPDQVTPTGAIRLNSVQEFFCLASFIFAVTIFHGC